MNESFIRSEMILGSQNLKRLHEAKVAVFGIGGVGGYVVEALARSGVGAFVLVDHDTVSRSNLNRQIIATNRTIGMTKVDIMKERILDINPDAAVEIKRCFYLPENAEEFNFTEYSYVVDAVDTVTAKLQIIQQAKECNVPVISSMGTGNKLDATKLQVADIYQTSVCPLAKVMRHECKKRGITDLKVVFSTEEPVKPLFFPDENKGMDQAGETEAELRNSAEKNAENRNSDMGKNIRRKDIPGSLVFVPAAAGLIIAREVVKDLTAK